VPGSNRRDARKRWSTVVALVATVLAISSLIGGGVAAADAMTCKTVRISVALTDGGTPDQQIQGELCADGDPRGRPVQVLVHGFTMTHDYWSLPGVDSRYSYVAAATARGYTTLAVDRIGVGGSSKPAATAITMDSDVTTIHDVVAALRAGAVTGAPAPAVVLVGHSFGSAISVTEAAAGQRHRVARPHPLLPRQIPGGRHRLHRRRRSQVRPGTGPVHQRRPQVRAHQSAGARRLHLLRRQPGHQRRPERPDVRGG
jgi:pimeloyl-ACP methyl ester carboxylesterase